jgi:hypothetical protein
MKRATAVATHSLTWLAVLTLLGSPALAGPVHSLFAREILGIPWTASRADIAAALPGGRWVGSATAQTYVVADETRIFDVRRTARQTLTVALNAAGKIDSVTITFPNGNETHLDLLESLTGFLGQPSTADTRVAKDAAGKTNVSIVWEENGLRVSLQHSIVTTTLTRNQVTVARVSTIP